MDSASYAAQSDPWRNRHFNRRWSESTDEAARVAPLPPRTLNDLAIDIAEAWKSNRQNATRPAR